MQFRFNLMKHDPNAVSPVLSVMLILVLMLSMITVVLLWGTPTIHSIETSAQYTSSIGDFKILNTNIENVLYGGVNATRTSKLHIYSGILYFKTDERWVISYIDPSYNGEITYDDLDDKNNEFYITLSELPSVSLKVIVYLHRTDGTKILISNIDYGIVSFTKVAATQSLEGTVQIEVFDGSKKIGEAWVFDINSLTYEMITKVGTYHIRCVNGGLTSDYPTGGHIGGHIIDSSIYLDDKHGILFFYIFQFIPTGITSAGSGNYDINIKLKDQYIREPTTEKVKDVQVQIFSKYESAWYDDLAQAHRYHQGNPDTFVGFVRGPKHESLEYKVSNPGEDNVVELKLIQCLVELEIEPS